MQTLLVITQPRRIEALLNWSDTIAAAMETDLTVLCVETTPPPPEVSPAPPEAAPAPPEVSPAPPGAAPARAKAVGTPEPTDELAEAARQATQDSGVETTAIDSVLGPDPAGLILEQIAQRQPTVVVIGAGDVTDLSETHIQTCERVLKEAACHVVVLDPANTDGLQRRRVLVPMGGAGSDIALRSAQRLVKDQGRVTPLMVGNRMGQDSADVARRELDYELHEAQVQPSQTVRPSVVLADRRIEGIGQRCGYYDLVLFGGASTVELRQLQPFLYLPSPTPTAVAVVRPARKSHDSFTGRLADQLLTWTPTLASDDRLDLFDRVQIASRWNADFALMIGLSAALATLGLLQGSTAVVIGAMVIAPLMTPLIGAGLALVQGNTILFRRSIRTVLLGLATALAVSILLTLLTPIDQLTIEVLSRGSPTLLDLAVAFFSGAAAAYAMARPNVASALAGVAIAAALVPPLAATGIALARWYPQIAEGASILLATNLVAIILGAAAVFRLLGAHGTAAEGRTAERKLWVRRAVLTLVLASVLLIAPLGLKTAQQLSVGQIRPMGYPLSPKLGKRLYDYITPLEGIDLVQAGRSGAEWAQVDTTLILSADRDVPVELRDELIDIVQDVRGRDVDVAIWVLKRADVVSDGEQVESQGMKHFHEMEEKSGEETPQTP